MKLKSVILIFLILFSGIFYYHLTNDKSHVKTSEVSRVIDGDTLVLTNGQIIRLKGINTPEKSMPYDIPAKELLIKLVNNKSIQIESHGTGKYGRTLAYLSRDGKSINKEILKQGLATLFYYEKDKNYEEFKEAEKSARLNQLGLWKKSPNADCLKLISLKINEPEKLTIKNNCGKELKVFIKDDATHIYRATLKPDSVFTKKFSHIWNNDGDTLYVSDTKGLLIFYRYGRNNL